MALTDAGIRALKPRAARYMLSDGRGYLVRLGNRKMLVLEVKGQDNQEQQTKREFLAEWVRAVNGHGGFRTWAADVSRTPTDIHEILAKACELGIGD